MLILINLIFTIKDTKLYLLVVTFSARHNQKLSNFFRKGFEKIENKNTINKYRNFLESNFVGFNRLLVLAYTN